MEIVSSVLIAVAVSKDHMQTISRQCAIQLKQIKNRVAGAELTTIRIVNAKVWVETTRCDLHTHDYTVTCAAGEGKNIHFWCDSNVI